MARQKTAESHNENPSYVGGLHQGVDGVLLVPTHLARRHVHRSCHVTVRQNDLDASPGGKSKETTGGLKKGGNRQKPGSTVPISMTRPPEAHQNVVRVVGFARDLNRLPNDRSKRGRAAGRWSTSTRTQRERVTAGTAALRVMEGSSSIQRHLPREKRQPPAYPRLTDGITSRYRCKTGR